MAPRNLTDALNAAAHAIMPPLPHRLNQRLQQRCSLTYKQDPATPFVSTGRSFHYSDLNGNGKEKKMVAVEFLFEYRLEFWDAVDVCSIDVIIKQKFLLTCPLSKSLAFGGVRGLSPGRFPEVSKEGYGWY